jgi:hypothetical protein
MIRPFELHDLAGLRRLAEHGLCLDTRLALTREVRSLPTAFWASLFPGTLARTYVWEGPRGTEAYAQLRHGEGSSLARLMFLAPRQFLDARTCGSLVEGLLREAGRRGAQHLLAEAEEGSPIFGFLRQEGFAVYARQAVWALDQPRTVSMPPAGVLRPQRARDLLAVRSLYAAVVPALIAQVEPAPREARGWVLFQESDLVGSIDVQSGPRGIWLEPFFHPAARDVAEAMHSILANLRPTAARPAYVCVRSYQNWLGPILAEAGLARWGEQAVLVRRIVVPISERRTLSAPAIEHSATRATPIRGHS